MRRPFVSAMVAILITEMSLGALFFAPRPTWLWHLAAMPAVPAHGLTLRLGLGGGPEGFPLFSDAALHVVTFLLWWPAVELVRAAWRRYGARRSTLPSRPG